MEVEREQARLACPRASGTVDKHAGKEGRGRPHATAPHQEPVSRASGAADKQGRGRPHAAAPRQEPGRRQ
jgi:hypothetical protein